MSNLSYLQPPAYCPNAIATDRGWVNPKNGELLASIRNLKQKIENAEREKLLAAEREKAREDTPSITSAILDKLMDEVKSAPVIDEEKSETQQALDNLTVEVIDSSKGKKLTLELKENVGVEEKFPGKKKAGRPKKES